MEAIPIRVECYAGYRLDEAPRFLWWGGKRFEVEEILDRWYQGGAEPPAGTSDYFKVSLRQGGEVIVRHDRDEHVWYLVGGSEQHTR